jgi:hypothetical protein
MVYTSRARFLPQTSDGAVDPDHTHDEEVPSGGGVSFVNTAKPGEDPAFVPHCQAVDFDFRGLALADWSLLEYVCCFETVRKDKSDSARDGGDSDDGGSSCDESAPPQSKAGRIKSNRYEFDPGHPLARTHVQQTRSLLYIPQFSPWVLPRWIDVAAESIGKSDVEVAKLTQRARTSNPAFVHFALACLLPWKPPGSKDRFCFDNPAEAEKAMFSQLHALRNEKGPGSLMKFTGVGRDGEALLVSAFKCVTRER